jgi:hypothetical protein
MDMTEVSTGSVRSFFRAVTSRNSAAKNRRVMPESLAKVRADHVAEDAEKFGAEPFIRGVLGAIFAAVRGKGHSPLELMRKSLTMVGEQAHLALPKISPEARRFVRATAFLAQDGLLQASDDDVSAVMDALTNFDGVPGSVRRMIGLVMIVFFGGTVGFRTDLTDEAAGELWNIAAAGESDEAVENAFDAASAWECRSETSAPVPFRPDDLFT